jgi:hypothetical protein
LDKENEMDWENLFPLLIGLSAAAGLVVTLLSRRKSSPKKADELYDHLLGIGVKARTLDDPNDRELTGRKRSMGEKSLTVIEVAGRNFDFVSLVGVSSQYGTNYYLEYLVMSPGHSGRPKAKKTKMVKKKSPPLFGKVVDIEWRGDPHLAQMLNFDHDLKYRLLHPDSNGLKGGISILPEPKHSHTRIRTGYRLPSPDLLEAINAIARHVKSWA